MEFDCSLSNSCYEKFNVDPGILHQVDEALFPYDPSWKRIAVNLSGGADSAVGTCILLELIEKFGNNTEVFVLTNIRVWNNRPWAGPISIEVYNKIREMFPNVNMQRIQNFIPPEIEEGVLRNDQNLNGVLSEIGLSGDRLCTQSFNKYVTYTYNLEAVYSFITNNPPELEFKHRQSPVDRFWNQERLDNTDKNPQFGEDTLNSKHVHPWKLISKDFIIGQYVRRGWEDLLNTTRSCEGDYNLFPDTDFVDYSKYKHGVTKLVTCTDVTSDPDRGCYWCAEREWAKKKVNSL